MRKFNVGDIVLSKKYSVEQQMVFDGNGCFRFEPYIDDYFFNRKAYISGTYKQIMEARFNEPFEDKDEYQITFLDNGTTLVWVSGNDLILLMKN